MRSEDKILLERAVKVIEQLQTTNDFLAATLVVYTLVIIILIYLI